MNATQRGTDNMTTRRNVFGEVNELGWNSDSEQCQESERILNGPLLSCLSIFDWDWGPSWQMPRLVVWYAYLIRVCAGGRRLLVLLKA
jgi:hypothetical protein